MKTVHPALKRQDRLGKDPFAGFGTVVEVFQVVQVVKVVQVVQVVKVV